MFWYYNPPDAPPVFIGGRQPFEPKKANPSDIPGPIPQSPPLSQPMQNIMAAWASPPYVVQQPIAQSIPQSVLQKARSRTIVGRLSSRTIVVDKRRRVIP